MSSITLAVSTTMIGAKPDVVDAAVAIVGPNSVAHNPERTRVVMTLHTDHGEEWSVQEVLNRMAEHMAGGNQQVAPVLMAQSVRQSFQHTAFED